MCWASFCCAGKTLSPSPLKDLLPLNRVCPECRCPAVQRVLVPVELLAEECPLTCRQWRLDSKGPFVASVDPVKPIWLPWVVVDK